MGLFSNNKKLCPVCGNPTPRLLATKIAGDPICKECDAKIDLPDGAVNNMSLDDFKRYLAAFAENEVLQQQFQETYRFNIGFWGCTICLDETHGLFRMKDGQGWVFQGKALKGIRISEDGNTLFESVGGNIECYPSHVPEQVNALAPQIAQFHMQKQEFERSQAMEGLRRCMDESREERLKRERHEDVMYRPRFEVSAPVNKFRIEITLDHPYWHAFNEEISGPEFDKDFPQTESYLQSYREQANQLRTLAAKLMHMKNPAAKMTTAGGSGAPAAQPAPAAPAASAAPVDAAAEIQKYKALLDAGALTEEEFTAKKRQLLGI